MSKAVMISIRPEWCKKIASGEKTIEVRKTRPKIPTPFKCYIYETRGKTETPWIDEDGHLDFHGRGKVIGEFICYDILRIYYDSDIRYGIDYPNDYANKIMETTRMTLWEMADYLDGKDGYAWRIKDLVIYDEPKPLTDFYRPPCERMSDCGCCPKWDRKYRACLRPPIMLRAPQSWCYVEGEDNG